MLKRIEPEEDFASFKFKDPFVATVISNETLTHDEEEHNTKNIVLDLGDSNFRYVEGQSMGIIPEGLNSNGKPHKQRIYSIASGRYGDDGQRKTVTLCVRRVNVPNIDKNGEMYKGVCSNYLCDRKVGDKIRCTGPLGKVLLMPEDQNTRLILIATGTGIAPFRGMIKTITEKLKSWNGGIDIYLGYRFGENALYANDINSELKTLTQNTDINIKTHYAFSATMKNEDGGRMHIQYKIKTHIDELWSVLEGGNFALYICGLKGASSGIDAVFEEEAIKRGANWTEMKDAFKKEKRWNVEVY